MSKTNQSHPKSLRKQVRDAINIPANSHLLLAVSGGSDSMALLHVLAGLRDEKRFKLSVVTINHGLRAECVDEVELVKNFCNSLNVDCYDFSLNLKDGGNVQERAREARYEVFRNLKVKIGANYIVTAHHKNDRAETVLMRIITGTSVYGLDVLRVRSDDLLRPMIGAYKRDVMLHITRKNIPYVNDPSNMNTDKYLRSKVRYNIMPELEKINPNIAEALCNLSDNVLEIN